MSLSLAEVTAVVHELWPLSGAESWDASGLVSGDPASQVSSIHLAVDAVSDTVDEAIEAGADLLLVHHPLLLRGVTSVCRRPLQGRTSGPVDPRELRAARRAHQRGCRRRRGVRHPRPASRTARHPADHASAEPGTGIGRVGRLARACHARPSRPRARRPASGDGIRSAGRRRLPATRRDRLALRRRRRLAARPPAGARLRRVRHLRPAAPPGVGVARAGQGQRAARPSSTCPTGPANGSGSTPRPRSCARRCPASR